VADNGRGTAADPSYSLYRQNGDFAVTGVAAEEMMEGVEDMQLTFGIDNVGNADGIIDIYKAANDLAGAAPNTAALWSSAWNSWDYVTLVLPAVSHNEYSLVRAVRYSLLMRTESDNLLRTPQQLSYNGAIFVSPDKRLRQVFTGTVGIRSQFR
jgi:type IV pilus assembly protein PilW